MTTALLRASDVDRADAYDPLLRGMLYYGEITQFLGVPGSAKTFVAMDWVARMTRGWPVAPWLPLLPGTGTPHPAVPADLRATPGNAVVVSPEDKPAVIARRLAASGADLARVAVVSRLPSGERFSIDIHQGYLRAATEEIGDVRLAVFDPLLGLLTSQPQNVRMRKLVLNPLTEYAERYGPAVLLTNHLQRGLPRNITDPSVLADKGYGGSAVTQVCRVNIAAIPCPDVPGEMQVVVAKSNCPPMETPIQYAINKAGDPADGYPETNVLYRLPVEQCTSETGRAVTMQNVMRYLQSRRGLVVSAQELATRVPDLSWSDARLLLRNLAISGMLEKCRGGYRELPA